MIGYYVHHQGAGHVNTALAVIEHLKTPATVFSSLARPPGCRIPWIELADDDTGICPRDVDAHGTLHWVPVHDAGLASRAADIAGWVDQKRPALFVVDVSVEVALMARLGGVPVVVAAMPGLRNDRAHRLAYDLAEALIAPWSHEVLAERWCGDWVRKAHFVGALSRFDDRSTPPRRHVADARGGRGLLLWGTGGKAPSASELDAMVRATPSWSWDLRAVHGGLPGPQVWQALCDADVVVSHGGLNSVAEIAAARAPAVLIADRRPFSEQQHTVQALDKANIALGLDSWPAPERWPRLLRQALRIGGSGWRRWSYGDAAERAATLIDSLAAQLKPASRSSTDIANSGSARER